MIRAVAFAGALALAALLFLACEEGEGSPSGQTPTPAAGPLAFDTIEQGDQSGIQGDDAVLEVVRSQEEWEEFWTSHRAGRLPETDPPAVDFAERMVLAVIDGQEPTGGHTFNVTSIGVVGDRLIVSVERSIPGEGCLVASVVTWPFHIVETERSDLEAGFDVTDAVFECG
jgi:hypothetical protein